MSGAKGIPSGIWIPKMEADSALSEIFYENRPFCSHWFRRR